MLKKSINKLFTDNFKIITLISSYGHTSVTSFKDDPSPVMEKQFLGVHSQFEDVVDKSKERCQWKGTDKNCDESILDN